MPVDPSIPLQAGKTGPDPLESAARVFTLKAAMQQAQLGDYELHDQLTLRDASSDPRAKNPDGTLNATSLLSLVTGKVSPKTQLTLTDAAQKQQIFQQQQEDRKRKVTEEFFTKGGQIASGIMAKYEPLEKQYGPEKAGELVQDDIESMRQQLQQITGIQMPPHRGIDSVRQFAMHNAEYVKNQQRANQPETPAEAASRAETKRHNLETEDTARKRLAQLQQGFEGKNGELMAALAERGVSLPTGFRSKAQQVALLNGLRERNPGLSADDIAEKVKSGQIDLAAEKKETQTAAGVGGRVSVAGEEIQQFTPLVEQASKAVPRGSFVPINKLLQTAETGISDPNLKKLKSYIQSTLNAYDLLAARGGTDVKKREENHALLTSAESHEALMAGLEAFNKEVDKARNAAEIASLPRSQRDAARKRLGNSPQDKKRRPLSDFSGG